jgi:hypothetical protein
MASLCTLKDPIEGPWMAWALADSTNDHDCWAALLSIGLLCSGEGTCNHIDLTSDIDDAETSVPQKEGVSTSGASPSSVVKDEEPNTAYE